MNNIYNKNNEYKAWSLGYYYKNSVLFFGEDSKCLKYLQQKADDQTNGFYDNVIADETQVVNLLKKIHLGEIK